MVARFAEIWLVQGYREYDFDEAVEQLTRLWANALGLPDEPAEPRRDDGRGRARPARRPRSGTRSRRRPTRTPCSRRLGWTDMLAAEPDDAIAIVFDALGRTNATASAIDDVVVHAARANRRARPRGAAPPVRHAHDRRPDRPGHGARPDRDRAARPAGRAACARSRSAMPTSKRCGASTRTPASTGCASTPSPSPRSTPAPGGDESDATAWRSARSPTRSSGAAHVMLDLAREHALERVQFGRPVAQFQAVRHRLAEALVAIEALDATLAAAADEPGPLTAQLAKATAGRTARTVAGHAQQVLAGIGFTTDHPFHRYLKRTMLLDGMFGSSDDLVVAIGHAAPGRARGPDPDRPVAGTTMRDATAWTSIPAMLRDGAARQPDADAVVTGTRARHHRRARGRGRGRRAGAARVGRRARRPGGGLGAELHRVDRRRARGHDRRRRPGPREHPLQGHRGGVRARAQRRPDPLHGPGVPRHRLSRAAGDAPACRSPRSTDIVLLSGPAGDGAIAWTEFLARGDAVTDATLDDRVDSIGPDDPSDVVFTSGTTGSPKGVVMTHGQTLRAYLDWCDWAGSAGRRPLPHRQPVLPHLRVQGRRARVADARRDDLPGRRVRPGRRARPRRTRADHGAARSADALPVAARPSGPARGTTSDHCGSA